ncbi:DNA starvation/stationary phase protection protein [Sphingobacterium sp. SRCM116780]|uniref:Dps family protein n=1 Tax=Sphingobacterium sp. SRCM116780 TaxID=2907623 RepID=UPI001F24F099|nr:DNA starvation/stationary phase protection protein [Sphingobacterium sp. SRCM116780]UIR54501.1 DNA starvation/stationary phase protection protein [Sphingobacterium sp. SRCM116780]
MKAKIGIKETDLVKVTAILNNLLADENIVYQKTRNAHWNVEGPDFHAAHLFLETQYTELAEIIDEVAERVRMLGHYAVGSYAKYLQLTHLKESQYEKTDSNGFYKELLSDHESIAMNIRGNLAAVEKAGDQATEDFLIGILEQHEKMAWMLRAHFA